MTLIEVDIPPWPAISRGYLIAVLTGVLGGVLLISLGSLLPAVSGVLVLAAIGLILATAVSALAVSQRSITRSVSAAIGAVPREDPHAADVLRILAESLPKRSYPNGFNLAARTLAERGYRGLVIRCCPKDARPVRPFAIEFEPCPLNEVDASFRGIALDTDEFVDSDERASESWRRLKRLWRLGALWLIVPFLFLFSHALRDAWQSRTLTGSLLVWVILLLVIAVQFFVGGTHSSHYWIAPGCLIRRMSVWATGKHGIDMLYPQRCVLIEYRIRGTSFGWTIASRSDEVEGKGTELETRTLLRAWLSPLTPPSLERVRRLCGGCE